MSTPGEAITQIELGCGSNKREGFFGIDRIQSSVTDCVLNFEQEPLPFPSDSIDHVYSSHCFEHLTSLAPVLRGIMRVCKHDALVEIWTPYGFSRDAFLLGHELFLTEEQWKHICYLHDRYYFEEIFGYLLWERVHYHLRAGVLEELDRSLISFDFALQHMFDIAIEWGLFLRVKKDAPRAPGTQNPVRTFAYGREQAPALNTERRKKSLWQRLIAK